MLYNRVKIHKQLRPEHTVDLGLASRIPAHEPLERSRFVSRVVIHMHRRVPRPGFQDQVDHGLECCLLVAIRISPSSPIARLAVRSYGSHAEQILAPTVPSKGIAFEVQKEISG